MNLVRFILAAGSATTVFRTTCLIAVIFSGLAFSANRAEAGGPYQTPGGWWAILWNSKYANDPRGCLYLPYFPNGQNLGTIRQPVAIPPLAVLGTQIGRNFQCTSFVQNVTGAPATGANGEFWSRGRQVAQGGVQPGTAIATFAWSNQFGRWVYSGTTGAGHTAVFAGYGADGSLWVFDQNWSGPYVTYHSIRGFGSGATDVLSRFAYFVVQ